MEWKWARRALTTSAADMSILIEARGPVAAGSVVWRLGSQTRVTLIVKTSVGYDASGRVRAIDENPVIFAEVQADGQRCDLAPFLRGAHVVCSGPARAAAGEVAIYVKRGEALLLKRALPASAAPSLGPVPTEAPEGLARFGAGVVSLTAGMDGHRLSIAPREQRMGPLRGDETVVLEGLDPDVASVAITLPPLELRFAVHMGTVAVPFSARLDTLALEPSARRLSMVWRGSFAVREEDLGAVKASVTVTMGQTVAAAPDHAPRSTPFSPHAGKAPPPLAQTLHTSEATGTVNLGGFIKLDKATPFETREPAPNVTASLSREELARAAGAEAVPFGGGGTTPQKPRPHTPIPGAPWAGGERTPVVLPSAGAEATLYDEPRVPAVKPRAPEPAVTPKTPEQIEKERPKEAWVRGPELDLEAAKAPPKRAKRKDLNSALYSRKKK